MIIIDDKTEFEWDEGNKYKSLFKHKVTVKESEEVLLNRPILIVYDEKHSFKENRYLAVGKTSKGRLIAVIFTHRRSKVRVISARPMNIKEKLIYEKIKKNTKI